MEHSAPVNRNSHATANGRDSSTAWNAPGQPPAFFAQMEQLLGEHSEPDTDFFVDTWTMGLDAAAHSFQARRHGAATHGNTPSFRSFDFSMPLFFVEEPPPHPHTRSSVPSGFPSRLNEAYGINPSTSSQPASATAHTAFPSHGEVFNTLEPGQPLTLQSACQVLGVAATSSRDQIKTAYRQLVRRYHPDQLEHSSEHERRIATDRMSSINQAYHLLCNPRPAES